MPKYTRLADGIYRDERTSNFYERPTVNGKRTWRKLDARTLKIARDMLAARRTTQARAQEGLARSPYAPPVATVGTLVDGYVKAGCPDKHFRARTGKQLSQEICRTKKLSELMGEVVADDLRTRHCLTYHSARVSQVRAGSSGNRTVDLELSTLSSILRWALRRGLIDADPLHGRRPPRFQPSPERKCREAMPADANELHALAAHLFDDRRSEALGWQMLLESFTGCRTIEVLKMRWDAAPHRAGYVDGEHLWLERAKRGVNPFVLIHPALRSLLDELKRWRKIRRPKSPWFIPSYRHDGRDPIDSCSLTHALQKASALLCNGAPRTSHGLRAYYVTVRRSQGISDGQIAAEIGDSTGAAIISSTYGDVPPNWRGGEAMSWMPPDGIPAWTRIEY